MTLSLAAARAQFPHASGYLDAATLGLPPNEAVRALRADLVAWGTANRDPAFYGGVVESARGHYARIVGTEVDDVAIGSQTSVMASVVATALAPGSEVLVVDGDFTSIVFPFLVRDDLHVRSVRLRDLPHEISSATALIAFSLIQSATGEVAPVEGIRDAAREAGALTVCDVTQAAGVHPVAAADWDITLCHAYKWLCSPRGVAFMTMRPEVRDRVRPVQAGWYAGDDIWRSIYGPRMALAPTARRFDVSPAWQAWVGAEPSLALFAELEIAEVWSAASALGARFLDGMGEVPVHQSIVTIADPDGSRLAAVRAAGLAASGRDGRLRLAFHLWNDDTDVLRAISALSPTRSSTSSMISPPSLHALE